MKIGFISDIHSNLEALTAALLTLELAGAQKVFCLGDIVGYGANPRECIAVVREKCEVIVAGNHDWAAVGKTETTYFNALAKIAALWTSSQISAEQKLFLATLPLVRKERNFSIVHASNANPADWRYILRPVQAQADFAHFDKAISFIGHSHRPAIFAASGEMIEVSVAKTEHAKSYDLAKAERYIINVGSVGQPRDGDNRACTLLFDTAIRRIMFLRSPYNVAQTMEKIAAANLPTFLAERLLHGK